MMSRSPGASTPRFSWSWACAASLSFAASFAGRARSRSMLWDTSIGSRASIPPFSDTPGSSSRAMPIGESRWATASKKASESRPGWQLDWGSPLRGNDLAGVAGLDSRPDEGVYGVVDAVNRSIPEKAVQALRVPAVEVVDVRLRVIGLMVAATEDEEEMSLNH